jgi:excisionase family DNA binding protein
MIQFEDELRPIELPDAERPALKLLNETLAHVAVADHGKAMLIGPNGEDVEIPASLFRVLRQAVALLTKGARVVVAPIDKEISTQEAADLLNVSRPYLVSLIDKEEIPCEKTGRYRKLRFGEVLAYKEQRNANRRRILAEMMRKNREAGLYDIEDAEIPTTR